MLDLPPLSSSTHPVLSERGFVIHTAQLTSMHAKVKEALNAGANALAIYGDPGSGKTTASLELVAAISDNTPTFSAHILCRQYQNPNRVNINNFWNDVLIAAGRTELGSRKADAEQRLYRHILTRCEALSNRRIFLIFDEAQNLPAILLAELKNFHDKLLEHKLYPFFLFVGQNGLLALHKRLVGAQALDLVRRFFLHWHQFESPPLEDLGAILNCYDEVFRFPPDGPTFTEYFAPKSYSTGWRLQHEAKEFAEDFRILSSRCQQRTLTTVEMHHITAAVRYFLVNIRKAEKLKSPIRSDEIRKAAVEHCGLIEQWSSFVH